MGLAAGLVVVSVVLLISLAATPTGATPYNVTLVLNAHPGYSQFNDMLTSTGVADEINARSSLTILVVSNTVLSAFLAAFPNAGTSEVGDLLRYHTLLQYLDIPELQTITTGNPSTVTTLYQTTGRAAGNSGSVNIYNDGTNLLVGQADVNTTPNTTIVTNVTQIPYNISILEIDNVVAPTGFGATPTGANISAILETGKTFDTFNTFLQSTGVDSIFAARETGAGITIFAPSDAAIAALPGGAIQALTPAQAQLFLEYHALASYYTLGSLTTLNDPAASTVATVNNGAGTYLVNVSSATSGVSISSGVSVATISRTLYDTPPTVVFAIDTVLLPPAIFATAPAPAPALVPAPAPAPINGSVPVPAPAPLTLTPTPAPAPLTPTPAPAPLTPTPAPSPLSLTPAPAPLTPSPTPTPAPSPLSPSPVPVASPPGPPSPPTVPIAGEPVAAPTGSPGKGDATSTSMSLAILSATVLISSVAMLWSL